MRGEHKAGYERPKTGEPRETRQPLRIDRMPQEVRDAILGARSAGKTWEETAALASSKAGESIAASVAHRWYDLRVEQVKKEVLAQSERARALAEAFRGKEFKDLPEAAMNALASEVFAVMEAGEAAQREKALGNLAFVLSKMITAQAKQRGIELLAQKIELDKKKFDQLVAKANKETNDAAAKLGKGKALTIDDINRIRERALGLPPVAR